MEKLWLFTNEYAQVVDLQPFHKKEVLIGNEWSDTVTLSLKCNEKIILNWDAQDQVWYRDTTKLPTALPENMDGRESVKMVMQQAEQAPTPIGYYIGREQQIVVSESENADFSFSINKKQPGFLLSKEGEKWRVYTSAEGFPVYLNGKRVRDRAVLETGDVLFWGLNEWTLEPGELLALNAGNQYETTFAPARNPRTMLADKYPDYQRIPRLIYERPTEKVKFSWPSDLESDSKRNLWMMILPPAIMLLVMTVVLIVQPSGIYMLISIVMFLSTMVTSVYQYVRESKQTKVRRKERKENYTNYLREKREELNRLYEKQRFVLRYQFPDSGKLKELADQLSPRIWERSRGDDDFLDLRLGITTLSPDYEIQGSEQDLSNRSFDELYREAKTILDHYRHIHDVPLTIQLLDGPLGLVGKHSIIRKAVQQMILQLAFFHSYHDLRFILLFDETEYSEWAWLKWLPHLNSLSTQGRSMVYSEQTRDQLLSGVYELLKERTHTDKKEKKIFLPHIVFVVASDSLIHEHEITEFLNKNYTDIGMSSIFLANTKDNLNENVTSVVRYVNETEGDVPILNRVANGRTFTIDPFNKEGNERFARRLASLKHRSGYTNSIPGSVTFLEMMHGEDVRDLNIRTRWAQHDPIQSLAVPVGLRSKNDVLELNLHEKAHGPHGLLAGTTGSGKSEFLQSYILALAVNFHPHDIAFLLIDFKGGGMAQLFDKLPHLLGTMTNINDEKNFSDRALAAVKSESRRRQMLFSENNINHIDDYQLLYKQGKVKQPLPHLFIISDEFAELKKEEPDFIRELVTTARIGRSLGIHLILATQKPAGVVDDQIRSNSRFKIALRVQDKSDSNDILGNGDAAELKHVGRGYLQVGNNEMYELFQSAWSGAPYEKTIYTSEDDVFYVRDTGFYPISEVHAKKEVQAKKESELEAVVASIADLCQEMGVKRLRSPWIAPLPLHIVHTEAAKDDRFMIGLADHPEKQEQTPVSISLLKAKNMAVFGASGFGKTTTITSYLLEAARRYSPDQTQFYIFDFGSGGLLSFRTLHHTGDYFRLDEKEKMTKFSKWLNEEIQRRKDLMQHAGVPDIALFNEQEDQPLPYLKIIVDNFEALREEAADALEESFVRWAREGGSLGIQFILSVSRANGIRPNLLSSLPIRLSHYMTDQSEFYTIFSGSVKKNVEAIPGRALIKIDELETIQTYLPFDTSTASEYFERLREEIRRCNQSYPESKSIYRVPMLPERLDVQTLLNRKNMDADTIYFGLGEESVEPLGVSRRKMDAFIIVGDSRKGKTNSIRLILEQIMGRKHSQIAISDSEELVFAKAAEKHGWMYLDESDTIELYIDQLETAFSVREQEVKTKMLESGRPRAEIAAEYPTYYLLIDGLDTFLRKIDSRMQTRLINLMKRFAPIGFCVIASGNQLEWKGYDPLVAELKNAKDALLLIRKTDQSVFTLAYVSKEPTLDIGFGYLLHQGQDHRLMIPRTDVPTLDLANS
ncbi:type VII secretion protein EssC [Sporolactobacillus shoreicorticis]|uniref:Type VII secretion protein EssC n=1 Tax=Sporolactobacillus shoreicorticis TaxID=1923877 RepID=A0ABW5S3R2_9BACL|nr:type VII secretion protein EssC [Sporolactobacillus shoreicorticis]MCO7127673.1 type VII secretion protein EssC [Sporolactobacillus shoreicorticis]